MEESINSTESRSEIDSVMETLDSLFHKAVTHVQVKYHERLNKVLDEALLDVSYVCASGFGQPIAAEQIVDGVDKWEGTQHKKVLDTIEQLRGLLEYRKAEALRYFSHSDRKQSP
jgi:predicted RNA-binding protein